LPDLIDVSLDMRADVVIVGGGIMGAALAYWLTRLEPGASVMLIERDPTYATASSALSAASIRQQFSTAINIRISQESIAFLRSAGELLRVDGDSPDIGLDEAGYLYLANGSNVELLRVVHGIQTRLGADIALLTPAQLKERFPWLETADLAAGTLGLRGEGWFDGYLLLTALLRKARSQGARSIRGEVTEVELDAEGRRVTRVVLADGARIECGHLVNAAGPWARKVAALAGIDLPVYARRRTVFVVSCPTPMQRFPLLIDPSGFWIRPEGAAYIAGLTPALDVNEAPLEPEYDEFESRLWAALAARVPAFEQARLERAWAGYYEMNVFDHNGIVGFHPGIANFGFLNGFSGHGMQQGPVVGRGLAELILHGRYVGLDLSPLAYERIPQCRPLLEANVIG
jgi:FAD-dependent oxidoreductase domain-containing protein 1